MARTGRLVAKSLVSPNQKKWFPARQVEGLFTAHTPAPVAIPVAQSVGNEFLPSGTAGVAGAATPLPYASRTRRSALGEPGCARNVRWYFICAIVMTMITLASFGPGVRRAGAAGFQSLRTPQYVAGTHGGQAYRLPRGPYAKPIPSLAEDPNLLTKFILFLTAGLLVPVASLAMFIYYTVWVYKIHEEMRCFTDGQYPISPGKACGYCWIPFYNLYWLVHMPWVLSEEINSYLDQRSEPVNSGGVMTLGILAFIPGAFIGGLSLVFRGWTMNLIQNGLNSLWLNQSDRTSTTTTTGRPIF